MDFFIVGQGIEDKSLLGGRPECRLAAASDALLESTLWEAFPVCNLDSGVWLAGVFGERGFH